jgi:hypothetical protein
LVPAVVTVVAGVVAVVMVEGWTMLMPLRLTPDIPGCVNITTRRPWAEVVLTGVTCN